MPNLINIFSSGSTWLARVLSSINMPLIRTAVDRLVKETLGYVPRQLSDFNRFLTEELFKDKNQTAISAENYFNEKNITDPQSQIKHALEKFNNQKMHFFLHASTEYLTLSESEQKAHLNNLFALFFPQQEQHPRAFPNRYLDNSLIYKDDTFQYRFLTPAVATAVLELLR